MKLHRLLTELIWDTTKPIFRNKREIEIRLVIVTYILYAVIERLFDYLKHRRPKAADDCRPINFNFKLFS